MVELGGKTKKKQEVMDAILASLEGPCEDAEVLRFNILFQLRDLQIQMRDIIRGAAGRVEVWREEVQEILAWDARGGELEMETDDEGGEASQQVEEGQGGSPELDEPPAKKQKPDVQVFEGKGGGAPGASAGDGSVRKDLGGGCGVLKSPGVLLSLVRSANHPHGSVARAVAVVGWE